MSKIVKVSAYCRVSTDSDDQLNSLEYQTSYFTDYINKREDYEIFKIFADEGLSGTSWDKRGQFKEMLYEAGLDITEYKGELVLRDSDRTPKFTRILVKDVSRWARDVGTLDVLKRLKLRGVYVDFITANLTTESMSDDILVGLMMLLAESDSKDKSTKTIFGHAQGAKRGRILTADKFYGYKYIRETNDLEIIEHEAEIIRKVYELYLSGEGYRNIVKILTADGHFTRKGKPFVETTINRMLSNAAYKGDLIRNKMDAPRVFTNKKSGKLRDESEWIVHKGRIPAIISDEIFERAQELRREKQSKSAVTSKRKDSEYTGKLFCKNCGNNYIQNMHSRDKGGGKFFVCKTKKRSSIKQCDAVNIKKDTLDILMNKLKEVEYSTWLSRHIENIIDMIKLKTIPNIESKLDRDVERELSKSIESLALLQEEKKRIAYLYVKGSIEESIYNEMLTENLQKTGLLETTIEDLSLTNEDIQRELDEVQDVIKMLRELPLKIESTELSNKIIIQSAEEVIFEVDFSNFIYKKIRDRNKGYLDFLPQMKASKLIRV